MTTVAAAIISTEARWVLVRDHVLPRILDEGFDEVVVSGDGESGDGYRLLSVPPITGTTVDALIKRDVAAVATGSAFVWYFSDDHRPAAGSLERLREFLLGRTVSALIPMRVTYREGMRVDLNSGAAEGYCGGHSGVFHRDLIQLYPWTTAPHDRLWDLLHSEHLRELGVAFHVSPDVVVEDIEHFLNPEAAPWR